MIICKVSKFAHWESFANYILNRKYQKSYGLFVQIELGSFASSTVNKLA
jgi:uncharacterized membrane protein (DUF4010 family)